MKLQGAVLVRGKIAELILPAHIDLFIGCQNDRADYGFIGQGIYFPVGVIESEQAFVVGEIQTPLLVLLDGPVLGASPVSGLFIIDDLGHPDRILSEGDKGEAGKKKEKEQAHFSDIMI